MDSEQIKKLTAALYRVTDRMDDVEPLKWKLREHALQLNELYFQDESSLSFGELERRGKMIAPLLKSIIRMLELAMYTAFVSRINFEVLVREYRELEKMIFQTSDYPQIEEQKEAEKPSSKAPLRQHPEGQKSDKKTVSERQEKILTFLAEKQSASVGDLTSIFDTGLSEKTVQRDLNDLVVSGKVRAEGNRRWRRYYFIHQA